MLLALEYVKDSEHPHSIIFTDSQSIVKQLTGSPPPTLSHHRTYAWYLHRLYKLYRQVRHRTSVTWIKAHVGFGGNEYVDHMAQWASYLPHPPLPRGPPGYLHQNSLLLIGPIPFQLIQHKIPRRAHTHIHLPTSYLPWAKCGPFTNLPFKWQNGLLANRSFQPFWSLALVRCDHCVQEHAGDPLSYISHCNKFLPQRQQLICTFPQEWQIYIQLWFDQASPHDRRLFIRGLTPNTLWTHVNSHPNLQDLLVRERREYAQKLFRQRVRRLQEWMASTRQLLNTTSVSFAATRKRGPDNWAPTIVRLPPRPLTPYLQPPEPSGRVQSPKRRRQA